MGTYPPVRPHLQCTAIHGGTAGPNWGVGGAWPRVRRPVRRRRGRGPRGGPPATPSRTSASPPGPASKQRQPVVCPPVCRGKTSDRCPCVRATDSPLDVQELSIHLTVRRVTLQATVLVGGLDQGLGLVSPHEGDSGGVGEMEQRLTHWGPGVHPRQVGDRDGGVKQLDHHHCDEGGRVWIHCV